jgi:hypothetical protein
MAFLPFVPQLALGAIETGVALSKLNQLNKQSLPKYDMSPTQANVSMYKQRLAQGLPSAEIAAMQQAQASQNAGGYRQATELSGGQLSNAIGRIGQLQNINLATRMGQMQAQERRANQSALAGAQGALQGQMNMQTQYDMQRRSQQEQALGGALRAGLQGMGNALTYGAFDYLNGVGKGSGTPETQAMMENSAASMTPYNKGQYPMTQEDYFNMGTPFGTRMSEGMAYSPSYSQPGALPNPYGFSPSTSVINQTYNRPYSPVDFNAGYTPKSYLLKK